MCVCVCGCVIVNVFMRHSFNTQTDDRNGDLHDPPRVTVMKHVEVVAISLNICFTQESKVVYVYIAVSDRFILSISQNLPVVPITPHPRPNYLLGAQVLYL